MSSQEAKNIVTGSMVVLGLMVVLSNNYVKLLRDFITSKMSGGVDPSITDAINRTYTPSGNLRNPFSPSLPSIDPYGGANSSTRTQN